MLLLYYYAYLQKYNERNNRYRNHISLVEVEFICQLELGDNLQSDLISLEFLRFVYTRDDYRFKIFDIVLKDQY